jgi:hypothetical protein
MSHLRENKAYMFVASMCTLREVVAPLDMISCAQANSWAVRLAVEGQQPIVFSALSILLRSQEIEN